MVGYRFWRAIGRDKPGGTQDIYTRGNMQLALAAYAMEDVADSWRPVGLIVQTLRGDSVSDAARVDPASGARFDSRILPAPRPKVTTDRRRHTACATHTSRLIPPRPSFPTYMRLSEAERCEYTSNTGQDSPATGGHCLRPRPRPSLHPGHLPPNPPPERPREPEG